MNVKDMVKNNKKVFFVRYQKKELWYITECGFEFPVSIEDTGDASFEKGDKALDSMINNAFETFKVDLNGQLFQ